MNPVLLSAAFKDRRDATVTLNLMRRLISIAASSESGDQSGDHGGTRTGEGIKDKEIGMCLGERGNKLQKGFTAIVSILKVLWKESGLLPIVKNILVGSWWSVALMVLSLVAQLIAIVTTGGWSIDFAAHCTMRNCRRKPGTHNCSRATDSGID